MKSKFQVAHSGLLSPHITLENIPINISVMVFSEYVSSGAT